MDIALIQAKEPIIFILIVLFWVISAVFEARKKKKKQAESQSHRDEAYAEPDEPEVFVEEYKRPIIIPKSPLPPPPPSKPVAASAPVKNTVEVPPTTTPSFHLSPEAWADAVVAKEILDRPRSAKPSRLTRA